MSLVIASILGVVAIAVPLAVVIGTGLLLAVGGVIGCTRCALGALGRLETLPGVEASPSHDEALTAH